MKLSTKGKYAVVAVVDLALHGRSTPIALGEIADRQKLPIQYLEQLFSKLRRCGLVKSTRGQSGGYKLALDPDQIQISDVLQAVEEAVQTTRCAPNSHKSCVGGSEKCLTHQLWQGLENQVMEYLQTVTVDDVCQRRLPVV
ncbi:MAG: Rrf2 family transcriptional regulator [Pseudomonadota bacterium]